MNNNLFNLFTFADRWWDQIWGNGHTLQTDPTKRGWRARLLKEGSKTLLVGRPGKEGCFSVEQWPDGILDVAIYYDTPKYVKEALLEGVGLDAKYKQTKDICGWGLPFIIECEALEVDHV